MSGPTWLQDKHQGRKPRKVLEGPLYHYKYGSVIRHSGFEGQCIRCLRSFAWSGIGVHLKYCTADSKLEVQA